MEVRGGRAYNILFSKREGKGLFGRYVHRRRSNTKNDLVEIQYDDQHCIWLARDTVQLWAVVSTIMNFVSMTKNGLTGWFTISFSRRFLLSCLFRPPLFKLLDPSAPQIWLNFQRSPDWDKKEGKIRLRNSHIFSTPEILASYILRLPYWKRIQKFLHWVVTYATSFCLLS
jgi:hypothetical protein